MNGAAIENFSASPALLSQLLAQLESRNQTQPGNPKLLWQIAQTYRALGKFEQALHSYRAFLQIVPDHPEARYFVTLLTGEGNGASLDSCDSLASPFLRFENFLNEAAQNELWQATAELLPTLHASVVEEYGVVGLSRDTRRSSSNDAGPSIRSIFHERVAALVKRHRIIERLGIQNLDSVQDLQMSLIAYGDGDYFKPHRDAGDIAINRLRELTFVYHFFREPQRFSGGELCLFDAGLVNGGIGLINNFSCFEPRHNSILFFPSRALHEVRSIQCSSIDPLDGRFAIAGWALRREKSSE
ncbi:MAG TPA: 2OG-Fe(II) oxygenase [Gallionella sp.]|nr:2OG-Fe(II) oxygenase [Gallionella sp.]